MVAFYYYLEACGTSLKFLFRQEEQTRDHKVGAVVYFADWDGFYHNVEGMTYLYSLYFFSRHDFSDSRVWGFSAPDIAALGKLFTIIYVLDLRRNHHGRDREFQSGFG